MRLLRDFRWNYRKLEHRCAEDYGYTEAEAVGKPISMLVPPELPDEGEQILERLSRGSHRAF